jgi:hypothetical protein
MGAPSFKKLIEEDISTVFLNKMEFADTHTIDGVEMPVLIDENELLERDKAKMGTHIDGIYKTRRLIYVAKSEFGLRPAQGRTIALDGRAFQVADCLEEYGILSIELEAMRS